MGKLLESYLATALPHLQAIVADEEPPPTPALQPGVEGIAQPEGATTFPMGPEPPPMQAQAIGPGGEPTGPMATMAGPGAAAQGAPPTPSFDPATQAPGPTPTMPPAEGAEQQDRSGEFEAGPDSFAGMAQTHAEEQDPKDIDNAMKSMQDNGVDIDAKHAEVTGTPEYEGEDDPKGKKQGKGDPEKLTRQEKALILMEFGLSLMASSGTGTGTFASDIGQAGGAALAGHMGRKQAKTEQLAKAEEREQKRRLTEAQISKAERKDTSMSTDEAGNRIIVDKQSGESIPVLMDGKPVGADDSDKLDFQLQVEAFEGAYRDQIKDPKELHRRAVAFAKGVRQVAFPQLARQDAAKAIVKELNEGKNASQKFIVDGKEKRWKNMSFDEKTQTARKLVDMYMSAAEAGVTSTDDGGEANFGLSDEQVQKLEANTKYELTDGTWVAKRNGKLVEVDAPKSD